MRVDRLPKEYLLQPASFRNRPRARVYERDQRESPGRFRSAHHTAAPAGAPSRTGSGRRRRPRRRLRGTLLLEARGDGRALQLQF